MEEFMKRNILLICKELLNSSDYPKEREESIILIETLLAYYKIYDLSYDDNMSIFLKTHYLSETPYSNDQLSSILFVCKRTIRRRRKYVDDLVVKLIETLELTALEKYINEYNETLAK